jgi:hypothetical protein
MFLEKIQSPPLWSSVHKDIIFKFQYPLIVSFVKTFGGFCKFEVYSNNLAQLRVGDSIFVQGGIYSGYHAITKIVNANEAVTNRAFISNQTVNARFLYVPDLEIWTGLGGAIRPIKKIGLANPNFSTFDQNRITFNVSAYLKSDFPILPPVNGQDYNLYNKYWIKQVITNSKEFGNYFALNSTVPNPEIEPFVNSGKALNQMKPIRFTCGKTLFSQISTTTTIINDVIVKDFKLRNTIIEKDSIDEAFQGFVLEDGREFLTESNDFLLNG